MDEIKDLFSNFVIFKLKLAESVTIYIYLVYGTLQYTVSGIHAVQYRNSGKKYLVYSLKRQIFGILLNISGILHNMSGIQHQISGIQHNIFGIHTYVQHQTSAGIQHNLSGIHIHYSIHHKISGIQHNIFGIHTHMYSTKHLVSCSQFLVTGTLIV